MLLRVLVLLGRVTLFLAIHLLQSPVERLFHPWVPTRVALEVVLLMLISPDIRTLLELTIVIVTPAKRLVGLLRHKEGALGIFSLSDVTAIGLGISESIGGGETFVIPA